MSDLREHLFEVLERLKDPEPETPMDIDTAKAIVGVADTIIDSARVENEYLREMSRLYTDGGGSFYDQKSSLFLPESEAKN